MADKVFASGGLSIRSENTLFRWRLILVIFLAMSVTLEPLGEKIVVAGTSTDQSNLVESIDKGLVWHPPFDTNCGGESTCSHQGEVGHFPGADYVVLSKCQLLLARWFTKEQNPSVLAIIPETISEKPPHAPPKA